MCARVCVVNLVHRGTLPYHFDCIRMDGGLWRGRELTRFSRLSSFFQFFVDEPTVRTAWPIWVNNDSNKVVSRQLVPVGVRYHITLSFGGHLPQIPSKKGSGWKIPSQNKNQTKLAYLGKQRGITDYESGKTPRTDSVEYRYKNRIRFFQNPRWRPWPHWKKLQTYWISHFSSDSDQISTRRWQL
jgi:hypothetical protein